MLLIPVAAFGQSAQAVLTPDQQAKANAALLAYWVRGDDGELDDHAAANATVSRVSVLIGSGADVNARSKLGVTPLMGAASAGSLDCVKLLVSKGANVDAKDYFGHTALLLAAKRGNLACAKFLTSEGADVNAKTGVISELTRLRLGALRA